MNTTVTDTTVEEQDLEKALKYYQKAKQMGESIADERIDVILEKLWRD